MRDGCAIAAIAAIVAAACGGGDGVPTTKPLPAPDGRPAISGAPRSPRIANYKITAKLEDGHRIKATETLTWTNTGQSEVRDYLPFHLYLNAFKNESSVFMRESKGQHRNAVMSESGWGWIEVSSVKIAGTELRPVSKFTPPDDAPADETVLAVPLTTAIPPGGSIAVDVTFTAQLPEVFARTGYKGSFTMAGQWFPKIGVRTGAPGFETWACAPFHVNAEFFADFGTYDVTLTVPQSDTVAATGVLVSATDVDGMRVLTYRAEDVHDFAWMADPYMTYIKGDAKVEGRQVEVRVYHRPEQADFAARHLQAAIGTIEQMSELFIAYPWPIMSVIDPPPEATEGAGGMEYPTLVTTGGDSVFYRHGLRLPEFVTVHEVGHNWFQGMLASNEVEEGWMDEGVNEWADAVVMERIYGNADAIDWIGFTAEMFRFRRWYEGNLGDIPSPIATASYAFTDFDAYTDATYGKTMMALRTLENAEKLVGKDGFEAAMGAYAKAWAFRHPTGQDLFATLRDQLGDDISWFVGPAFYGTGAPDLAVRSTDCRPAHDPRGVVGEGDKRKTIGAEQAKDNGSYDCEVVVENLSNVPVIAEVEVGFEDGSRLTQTWDGRDGSHWHKFAPIVRSSPIAEVEIDPKHNILLGDHPTLWDVRLQPDNRASWRAAARVGFWAQTTMSVFGL